SQPGGEDPSPPPGARRTHGGRVARPGRRRADAGAGLARARQGGHQGRAAPQQRGPQDLAPRAHGGRARYDELAISSNAASKQASSSRALLSSRSSRRSTRSARSRSAARPRPRLLSTSQRGMPSRSAIAAGVSPCSTSSATWSARRRLAARKATTRSGETPSACSWRTTRAAPGRPRGAGRRPRRAPGTRSPRARASTRPGACAAGPGRPRPPGRACPRRRASAARPAPRPDLPRAACPRCGGRAPARLRRAAGFSGRRARPPGDRRPGRPTACATSRAGPPAAGGGGARRARARRGTSPCRRGDSRGAAPRARARRAGRTRRSEALHGLQVDVARQQLDQVVLRLPPTRLAELHVGQIGEVARVDRAALEVWRAADDDPALRAEILRLLEELVLEEEVAALALGEPQAHLHDALVLHRLVGRAEGDRHARETANGAGEHEVGVALGDDTQRPLPAELVLDGAVQVDVEPGLARAVGEALDADGPRALGDSRAGAGEMVAAGGEHEDGEERGAPHTIKLSMRPGTNTTLRIGRPATCAWMC